jgi:chromate transporter
MSARQIGGAVYPGSPREVLAAFTKLGVSAFGGPIAHLGYFRAEFVSRRRWLAEAEYADLVALCQFLPGPASSQVGFAIGLQRAGPLGALAAWIGFTLPSVLLMTALAFGAAAMTGPLARGAVQGLKLVAVAVVAQAVFGMARTLAPDPRRAGIALGAMLLVTVLPAMPAQLLAVAFGLLAGLLLCRDAEVTVLQAHAFPVSPKAGLAALSAYLLLLLAIPVLTLATGSPWLARFDAFYRSGALVFGGGHVVLPLLKQAVVDPGWIGSDRFVAGYGAAQAMPGPLFTFAAFLGAAENGFPNGVLGAAMAIAAIFLPGLLALLAILPFWSQLRRRRDAQAAVRGANAAVVGLLAVALYDPVWTGAVRNPLDFACVAVGFTMLTVFKLPPIALVLAGLGAGMVRAVLP